MALPAGQACQPLVVILNPVINFKVPLSCLNAEFASAGEICSQTSIRSQLVFFHSASSLLFVPAVPRFQLWNASLCSVPSFLPGLQHVLMFRCTCGEAGCWKTKRLITGGHLASLQTLCHGPLRVRSVLLPATHSW